MLNLIDADDAGLDRARLLLARRAGEADLWTDFAGAELLAPAAGAATNARRHVVCAAHPPVRRGARAIQPLHSKGRDAFNAVMQEPLDDLPAVYRELPIYYITNRFTVVGPGVTVNWPRYSKVMDYELEIGVVTRRTRSNIPDKGGSRAHLRLHDLQRLFGARPPGDRNAGTPRPGQRQELRRLQRDGSLDRHARRTRRSPDAASRSAGQR